MSFISLIYKRDLHSMRQLLADGCDPNEVDSDARTPLMHAVLAEAEHPDIVALLAEYGADLDRKDGEQQWSALHFAARDQKESVVRVLLELGADADISDALGNTPLWRCVMNRTPNIKLVKLLLDNGANPNSKNQFGVSPFDTARNLGSSDLVRLFGEWNDSNLES